ncbi:MAG: Sua5/YciO/YrdC/YwlC family protein, partial [Clostridia bacterium]|nr:Sua5/YciO/YrdC/YwlC family protein [Clostridia bacterium]
MDIKTKYLSEREEDLAIAADILRRNGTVIFPTETVYGLGANALSASAVKKIFSAKGRPSDNPLIVHIGNQEILGELVKEVPEKAKLLIEKFWPGPLT